MFLRRSRAMLMLLVQGPHFENNWFKESSFTLDAIVESKKCRSRETLRFFEQGCIFPILFLFLKEHANQTEQDFKASMSNP